MSPSRPDRAPARPPAREGLAARKLAERHAGRARIAARAIRPPSAEQRLFDPLARSRLSTGAKLAIAAVAVLVSSAVHAGVYGFGAWFGPDRDAARKHDIVAVEVRKREPEKPPEPPPPPPPEKRVTVKQPERRKVEPPPPPDKPPPPSRGKPPPRVVGLSLDSTSQTGDGPAFGVGNTRDGETETRAADPKKLPAPVTDKAPTVNQKASRIPSAGAKYVLPKRRRPIKPPYPRALLSQGIEAAVTVLVSLDATGVVTTVKIIKSGGFPEFDESARKTALAESFEPAMRDGKPIPYTLSYTYRFDIEQ